MQENNHPPSNSEKSIIETLQNPWNKVYWFARMLIDSDKYASPGKDNERIKQMGESILAIITSNKDEPDEKIIPIILTIIQKSLLSERREGTKVYASIEIFIQDIKELILNKSDALVFAYTCLKVISLSNLALSKVPSDDRSYTEGVGKSILESQGESGLKILINTWDDLGVRGCLEAERNEVLNVYQLLKNELENINEIDEQGKALTLTACIQEMERRLGQKRKGRGGRSLENVTSLILDHFNFESCPAPSHFQADIEVDKWVQTKRKWYVGISCKRTLRERWKQVSSAGPASMGIYKITAIWHVITYSKDLSDDKLALLGGQGHIFYLPDDDPTLIKHRSHQTLKNYVRPMSKFVSDLRETIRDS